MKKITIKNLLDDALKNDSVIQQEIVDAFTNYRNKDTTIQNVMELTILTVSLLESYVDALIEQNKELSDRLSKLEFEITDRDYAQGM